MLVLLGALALRAAAAWCEGAAQPQEIRYITLAEGIDSGQGYRGLDTRFPDIIQPPLYPLMLAAAFCLPGNHLALARGLSVVMGALLVLPLALLAQRLFGEQAAVRAAMLAAVYPLLIHVSSSALTEPPFALLVAAGALVSWRALEMPANTRRTRCLLSGLLMGLSFLTRPEGLAYLAAACVILLVCRPSGETSPASRLALPALTAAGFAAMAVPYVLWVHAEIGQWLLAPKAVLVNVHQSVAEEAGREGWTEPYGSLLFSERVKFGLNESATALRARERFAAVRVGITDGLSVSEEGDVSFAGGKALARVVPANLLELFRGTFRYGYAAPAILLLMAGIGLVSRPWVGQMRQSAFITLTFLAGSFSFILSHVQARFLYSAIVFFLPWAAEGWRRFEVWSVASCSGADPHRAALRFRLVAAASGAVVLLMTLAHVVPATRITSGLWSEHRELGRWLRERAAEGEKVMAVTPVTSYYAGAGFEVLPYDDLPRSLSYARHKGAQYLVADRAEIPTLRPQLEDLLDPDASHEGIVLVKSLLEGTPRAIFLYRILPPGRPAMR